MTDRLFHVMINGGYPKVPYAGDRGSNFIDLPNTHYDRIEGQRIIERQLKMFSDLEDFGFDGALYAEQHNGPIGMFGNPLLAGAHVAAHTKSIKIGICGPIINDYLTPIRLAEEVAALDVMSRGRLLLGLPMGHGMQHHSIGAINPATARARYREAHELFIKALTSDGPFEWFGKFFQIPYVNLWPRPLQDPHPEIVIFGGGSVETLEMVARRRYGYSAVGLNSQPAIKSLHDKLRGLAQAEGYELDRRQVWSSVRIHVAETDKQARQEMEAHELWSQQNFFLSPWQDNFPPGYLSTNSMRGVLMGGYRSKSTASQHYDTVVKNRNLIVGSPETVLEGLQELFELQDPGQILLDPLFDSKPDWLSYKTLQIFAEQVMPKLRTSGIPGHQQQKLPGYESITEYAVRRDPDLPPPTAVLGDSLIDVSTAHIEELRTPLRAASGD